MALKRLQLAVAASPNGSVATDGGSWFKKAPTVWEFISSRTFEDGTSRSTGTVMFMTDGGVVKLYVHDREAGAYTFVSALSPDGALQALEKGLVDGGLDWRADKGVGSQKKARS
jgi:hypothetical protein